MGQFGIYFNTHYYGEKRQQPSRRRRDAGKLVSSKQHFKNVLTYIQTRKQERGLNLDGDKVTLTDDEKKLDPLSSAQRMTYQGLPRNADDAWAQVQESASPEVTFRYFEFGPDPPLVEMLIELGRLDLVRPLVVDGFYEGLQAYCAEAYGAEKPPNMTIAYHEKFDQFGRPQAHLHALSEATLVNGDYDRIEMKLFKEQLADLREALDDQQGIFLDRHLPDIDWRTLYQERHTAWELERDRLEKERLGQELEVTLVATGVIEAAQPVPVLAHAEVLYMSNPPSDMARLSDYQPNDVWPEELPFSYEDLAWFLLLDDELEDDQSNDLELEDDKDEPGIDFDDFE